MTFKRIATGVSLLLLTIFCWMFRREVIDIAISMPSYTHQKIVADTVYFVANDFLPSAAVAWPIQATIREQDTNHLYISGILADYRAGKNNIFFDEVQFFADTLRSNPNIVEQLNFMLLDPQFLNHIEELPDILNHPTEILKQRMAAIDMLETFANSEHVSTVIAVQAVDTLTSMIQCPLPPNISSTGKRLLLAERHDAFAALVRANPYLALNLLEQFNNKKYQNLLAQAAVLGLVDLGISRVDAMNMTSPFNVDMN